MTHDQFITRYLGRFVDYDKKWGFQCVDLMRQYVKDVEKLDPYKAVPAGATAKTIFQNFRDNQFYRKVLNTPNGVPKQGDLVFWGFYPGVTGWAGHVGIYHNGNVYTFISLDQNYPSGKPVLLVKHGSNKYLHGYRGVLGWLTRK